jgi:uncharacterized protein
MKKTSNFKPAWWLKNSHLQTMYASFCGDKPELTVHWGRFELSDGDFLTTVSLTEGEGPIIVALHGLTGNYEESRYIPRLLSMVHQNGWCGQLMHFRGCGGVHNRMERSYHLSETRDLAEYIGHLRELNPDTPIIAVGFSLGGNVLLKWMGETGDENPLTAAVAVSVPFDVNESLRRFGKGLSRFYSKHLISLMRKNLMDKYLDKPASFNLDKLKKADSFDEFDNAYTAPVHGFASAYDYHQRSSSRLYLRHIKVPTLIIHAEDDPFMTPKAVPDDAELSSFVTLEVAEKGGHVGFVSGKWPWEARFWLNDRIESFLKLTVKTQKENENE